MVICCTGLHAVFSLWFDTNTGAVATRIAATVLESIYFHTCLWDRYCVLGIVVGTSSMYPGFPRCSSWFYFNCTCSHRRQHTKEETCLPGSTLGPPECLSTFLQGCPSCGRLSRTMMPSPPVAWTTNQWWWEPGNKPAGSSFRSLFPVVFCIPIIKLPLSPVPAIFISDCNHTRLFILVFLPSPSHSWNHFLNKAHTPKSVLGLFPRNSWDGLINSMICKRNVSYMKWIRKGV